MIENKDLTFHDKTSNFHDECSLENYKPKTILRGRVQIVDDETGETILDKDNLIVLHGRTFLLEKVFDVVKGSTKDAVLPGTEEYTNNNLPNRKICLFKVGNKGVVENQPFNPIPPSYDNTSLTGQVPFRTVDVNDTAEIKAKYFDINSSTIGTSKDGSQVDRECYFAKRFDNIEWVSNDDEIAIKLTLTLDEDDLKTTLKFDENGNEELVKNTFINELALYEGIVGVDGNGTTTISDINMATRITFESEPYYNQLKSSHIYYYIYA